MSVTIPLIIGFALGPLVIYTLYVLGWRLLMPFLVAMAYLYAWLYVWCLTRIGFRCLKPAEEYLHQAYGYKWIDFVSFGDMDLATVLRKYLDMDYPG